MRSSEGESITVTKVRSSFEGEWSLCPSHLSYFHQNCLSYFIGASSAANSPSENINRHVFRKVIEMGEKVDRIDTNIAKLVRFYEEHHIESLTKEDALSGFPLDNYQEWLDCQAFLASPKEMDKIVIISLAFSSLFINPYAFSILKGEEIDHYWWERPRWHSAPHVDKSCGDGICHRTGMEGPNGQDSSDRLQRLQTYIL